MCHCKDKTELVNISGDLEGSKFIYWGADNTGHLYMMAVPPGEESRGEGRGRNGAWEKGG